MKGEIHFNIGAFKENSRGLFFLEGILRVGECMCVCMCVCEWLCVCLCVWECVYVSMSVCVCHNRTLEFNCYSIIFLGALWPRSHYCHLSILALVNTFSCFAWTCKAESGVSMPPTSVIVTDVLWELFLEFSLYQRNDKETILKM